MSVQSETAVVDERVRIDAYRLKEGKGRRVKENYVPNQTALKDVFGKQYEAFLIPAQTTIIGYEVAPVAVMPEKAGEVEA